MSRCNQAGDTAELRGRPGEEGGGGGEGRAACCRSKDVTMHRRIRSIVSEEPWGGDEDCGKTGRGGGRRRVAME